MKEKTSYSVPEIKRMLGIGKTSAYALVKTGCFKSVIAGGTIRVMKDSFDHWLNSQTHYHLSDGFTGGDDNGINY